MIKRAMSTLMLLAVAIVTATSCATKGVVSKPNDLKALLKSIPAGESRYVTLVGQLRPYSGSFPKGSGLTEIAVGTETVLIHSGALDQDQAALQQITTVTARVKISHFPLPDSHPASQMQGIWITEISELN